MPASNFTFRVDENLKKSAENLFGEMGLNMSTAINAFLKVAVREGKMPFELVGDNYAKHREIMKKLREAEEYAASPDVAWYSAEDSFAQANALLQSKRQGG